MQAITDTDTTTQPLAYLPAEDDANKVSGSVTMSRALAESAHGLTLNEARVMMLAMRAIDPRMSPYKYDRSGSVKVRVTAAEFAQLCQRAGQPVLDSCGPRGDLYFMLKVLLEAPRRAVCDPAV